MSDIKRTEKVFASNVINSYFLYKPWCAIFLIYKYKYNFLLYYYIYWF